MIRASAAYLGARLERDDPELASGGHDLAEAAQQVTRAEMPNQGGDLGESAIGGARCVLDAGVVCCFGQDFAIGVAAAAGTAVEGPAAQAAMRSAWLMMIASGT
jgi:hypothetical protein